MTLSRAAVLLFTSIALVHSHQAVTAYQNVDLQVGSTGSSLHNPLLFLSSSPTCSLFPGTDGLAPDVWEVKLTPTKGRGVFAARDIRRGTHILTEPPLFAVAPPAFVPGRGFEMAAMVAGVGRAYARLAPADQQTYLSCHEERFAGDRPADPGWRLLAIFRSNAYTMQDGMVGIYPKVALINHSCQPNVLNADNGGTRVIVATRDIRKGEEILTTYIPLLMDTASRNDRLQQYGFQCDCEACRTRASDDQRVHAGGILRELEEPVVSSAHVEEGAPVGRREQQHWSQAEALASYVENEGFADYLVKTSRLASHYAAQARNGTSARRWAEKHLRHHEVVDRDSVESRLARQLLESLPL